MKKELYSIANISKMFNITAQTLRNWDKNGKLKPAIIGANGYRYYSDEQFEEIKKLCTPIQKR